MKSSMSHPCLNCLLGHIRQHHHQTASDSKTTWQFWLLLVASGCKLVHFHERRRNFRPFMTHPQYIHTYMLPACAYLSQLNSTFAHLCLAKSNTSQYHDACTTRDIGRGAAVAAALCADCNSPTATGLTAVRQSSDCPPRAVP